MTIALIITIIAFILLLVYHFWKKHQDKTTTNIKINNLEDRLTNLWSEKTTLEEQLDATKDQLKSYQQEQLLTGSIISAAQQVENYTKQINEKVAILNDLNDKITLANADLQKNAVDEQKLALSTSKLDKINANFKSNLMT